MNALRLFLLCSLIFALWTSILRSNDRDQFIGLFYEYIDIGGQLSRPEATPEIRERIIQKLDKIRVEMLKDSEIAGISAAEHYRQFATRGNVEMQKQLMHFAMQEGLAKPEFLAFAREVVGSADLDSLRDPLLTNALEYLGEHGEESDIELMARLNGHVNQTYAQIRDRFAERLRERLRGGDSAGVKIIEASLVQPEVREQPGPPGLLVDKPGLVSTGSRVSLNAFVSVVVFAILLFLIRVFLRGRAS